MVKKVNNKESNPIDLLREFDQSNKKSKESDFVPPEGEPPKEEQSEPAPKVEELTLEKAYSFLKEHLDEKELNSSPLEELYLKLTNPNIGEDWDFEDGKFSTQLEFQSWDDLKPFQDLMFEEGVSWNLESAEEGKMVFSVATSDATQVNKVEEVFTSLSSETEEEEQLASDQAPENSNKPVHKFKGGEVTQNFNQSTASTEKSTKVPNRLKQDEVVCFSQEEKKYVQLPIIKLGTYYHEAYGELKFDREVVDRVRNNLMNNELGFEPPLFYGHQEKSAPAKGFLQDVIFDEEDYTLYGIWETNQTVYDQIYNGEYRYSSSEFINDFMSKRSGEPIGKVFVGMALTNKPFMPDLPRNLALSDEQRQNVYSFSMELNNTANTNTNNNMETNNTQNQDESLTELKQELNAYKQQLETYSQQLETVKTTYEEQLKDANERIKELNQKVRQGEIDQKLDRLDSLNLPQEQKDKYKTMFEQGSLGSTEDAIMESLETMSKTYGSEVFTQKGSSEETTNNNQKENKNDLDNSPHSKTIQQNLEMAKSRREARRQSISSQMNL